MIIAKFQSTLPHGSDHNIALAALHNRYFNPRSLTGATGKPEFYTISPPNFNPRSLTGATLEQANVDKTQAISIHAPSRERLNLPVMLLNIALKFQSTLPHGSDLPRGLCFDVFGHFNPRSLTGATEYVNGYGYTFKISIHAPSRERLSCFWRLSCKIQFQSTLPHGSDPAPRSGLPKIYIFQSTLPHGSDNGTLFLRYCRKNFNPRSLTGATDEFMECLLYNTISIHAPSRERHSIKYH